MQITVWLTSISHLIVLLLTTVLVTNIYSLLTEGLFHCVLYKGFPMFNPTNLVYLRDAEDEVTYVHYICPDMGKLYPLWVSVDPLADLSREEYAEAICPV